MIVEPLIIKDRFPEPSLLTFWLKIISFVLIILLIGLMIYIPIAIFVLKRKIPLLRYIVAVFLITGALLVFNWKIPCEVLPGGNPFGMCSVLSVLFPGLQ